MKIQHGKTNTAREMQVKIGCEVARIIRQHASETLKAEVCGVLIGASDNGVTRIDAAIPGANAEQGGAHVTFTQDTWEHIYRIKDRDFPNSRIVGWYHSHPGFGVFLSDHDTFIHNNFFSAAGQVAWVYDPHSDEEGCFGWTGSDLRRLSTIVFLDEKAGELAGETGKPEPQFLDAQENFQTSASLEFPEREGMKALRLASNIFSYLTALLIGGLLVWFLFPHGQYEIIKKDGLYLLIDVRTMEVVTVLSAAPDESGKQPATAQPSPKAPTQNPKPAQSAPAPSPSAEKNPQGTPASKGTP